MDVTAPGAATSAPAETSEPAIAVPECLLCGGPAKFRCSSCAAAIDLHFCSKEHQKLVWPFHKLVCGERAHPFKLPPFTQAEADLAFKRLSTEGPSPECATVQDTLGPLLAQQIGRPFSVEAFTSPVARERLNALVGAEGLRQFSASTFEHVKQIGPGRVRHGILYRASAPFIVSAIEGFCDLYHFYVDLLPTFDVDSHWHSLLCHRLFLLNGSVSPSPPAPSLPSKSLNQLIPAQLTAFIHFAGRLSRIPETAEVGNHLLLGVQEALASDESDTSEESDDYSARLPSTQKS